MTVFKSGYFDRSIPAIIVSNGGERAYNLAVTPTTGVTNLFTLSGRVVNALNNQPIAGAMVSGRRSATDNRRYFYALTNAQGQFTVPNCIPGNYIMSASKYAGPGGVSGYYDSPEIEVAATAAMSDLLLPCAPEETPIANNMSFYYYYDLLNSAQLRAVDITVQSEAGWTLRTWGWDGTSAARLPANMRYTLTAHYVNPNDPDRYYPTTYVVNGMTESADNRYQFFFVPRDTTVGTLQGAVRNTATGTVVSGATISLYYGERVIASMSTDAQGRFTFQNVPQGEVLNVYVSKPGWTTMRWYLPPLTGTNNSRDFFIPQNWVPTGSCRYYVYDALNGRYLNNATARMTLTGGQSMLLQLPFGGYTEYGGWPSNQSYDITVSFSGYQSISLFGVSVPYNSAYRYSFYLPRSNQTTGRLVGVVKNLLTGAPVANALITGYSGQVRTNAQGQYTLTNQPIGTYNVQASLTGFNSLTTTTRVVSGDNTLDFFLIPAEYPTGAIHGDLIDNTTNYGVINGTLTIVEPSTGLTITDYTGPFSSFYQFDALPADRPFNLIATAPGYQQAAVNGFYTQRYNNFRIDIPMTPEWGGSGRAAMSSLKGRVRLDGYQGDTGFVWLTVEAYQYGAPVWRAEVHPKADGSFEVRCPALQERMDIRLKADRWLSVWLRDIAPDTQELPDRQLLIHGDTNNDDRIDDADLLILLEEFGKDNSNAPDLNGDGIVDDNDLMSVLFNFGAQGER